MNPDQIIAFALVVERVLDRMGLEGHAIYNRSKDHLNVRFKRNGLVYDRLFRIGPELSLIQGWVESTDFKKPRRDGLTKKLIRRRVDGKPLKTKA